MPVRREKNRSIPAPSDNTIVDFRRRLLAWGIENYADFPWRHTGDRFHALIAETMLQRTRAEQVRPVYLDFVKKYETPEDVLDDSEKSVLHLLKPLGLSWRARSMMKLVKELSERKRMPDNIDELLELTGVGPYAAAALLSFHMGKRAVIVDNNVVRLYSRYFGFGSTDTTRRSKDFLSLAERITPKSGFRAFNYALLDHTRALCRPKPLCPKCPLRQSCVYGRNCVVTQQT